MNIDFAVPLIAGLFVGGIITEVRWVLRLRRLHGQIALAPGDAQKTPEEHSTSGLHSLHDHLAAEGGVRPVIEPATIETPDASGVR